MSRFWFRRKRENVLLGSTLLRDIDKGLAKSRVWMVVFGDRPRMLDAYEGRLLPTKNWSVLSGDDFACVQSCHKHHLTKRFEKSALCWPLEVDEHLQKVRWQTSLPTARRELINL